MLGFNPGLYRWTCPARLASTLHQTTPGMELDFEGISSRFTGRFLATIQVIMRQTMVQDYNMNSVGVQPADFVPRARRDVLCAAGGRLDNP